MSDLGRAVQRGAEERDVALVRLASAWLLELLEQEQGDRVAQVVPLEHARGR